jgi:hypothetical protein
MSFARTPPSGGGEPHKIVLNELLMFFRLKTALFMFLCPGVAFTSINNLNIQVFINPHKNGPLRAPM